MATKLKMIPISHPGEILKEEFLDPLGIKPAHLAQAIGVTRAKISEICNGKRGITAETALLLARFFDTSARFWMNLQTHYELEMARQETKLTKPFFSIKQSKTGVYTVFNDPKTGRKTLSKFSPADGFKFGALKKA